MQLPIEPALYIDLQTQGGNLLCPSCGSTVYSPGFHCLRCERRGMF